MKTKTTEDPSTQARYLLAEMFKAGASHLYLFERMKNEPATAAVVVAAPPVIAEESLVLMALVVETAGASAKTVHQKGAKKAEELIPGLRGWSAPRSDWLGAGVERVPLSLVPLLLRRKAAWSDATLAQALSGCLAVKGSTLLGYYRPVIQGFISQMGRESKSKGLGEASRRELLKLQTKLSKFASTEISSLATWAKKQVLQIEQIIKREEALSLREKLGLAKP